MRAQEIYPFVGAVSAINRRSVPDGAATDHLNAREEDGTLRFRYGYRNLLAAQTGFSAILGLAYVQGYTSTTEVEEYVTAETISGNTRFYSRPADDGAPATEIKNGVTSVDVHASEWVFTAFDGFLYLINPNNTLAPVYRHEIGAPTSLVAVAIPEDPTVKLSHTISYGPGGATPYQTLLWTGIDPTDSGEVTVTGSAVNAGSTLLSDNTISLRHNTTETETTVLIDLNDASIGVVDHTYKDRYSILLTCEFSQFDILPQNAQLLNNDGSPITHTPGAFQFHKTAGQGGDGNSYAVFFSFDNKDRTKFDNIRWLKLTYKVTKASQTDTSRNDLIIGGLVVGGVYMWQPRFQGGILAQGLYLSYTYRFSVPGFESGASPLYFIPNSALIGNNPFPELPPLGVNIEVTATVSADTNVDQVAFYVMENVSGTQRFIAVQADSDLTYGGFGLTHAEIVALSIVTPAPFSFAGVTAAFPYKGSMVWLYKGGSQNIRLSRVGEPLLQASDDDSEDDLAAGATFTLADNFGDEPLGGLQAGDAIMIAGKGGVYTLVGNYPVQMFPPRRVAASHGVAGKYAFCRYRDDAGQAGIAYLADEGQVYFSIPGAFTGQEVGDTLCLTDMVRDGELSPKDFLLDEQASALGLTDFSTAQVFTDERQDALWVVMGKRAMVLRRRNTLDGVRYWEHYEYNTGGSTVTLRYCSGSTKRGLRLVRSDGKFDELEYNSTTRAFITGENSDAGNVAPAGRWRSRTMVGQNRRLGYVKLYREEMADAPYVVDYCTRVPLGSEVIIPANSLGERPNFDAQGTEHSIEIRFTETDNAIERMHLEWESCGNTRFS